MACGTCGSGRGVSTPSQRINKIKAPIDQDCIYTVEILQNWDNRFECIKSNNTYHLIGSSEAEVNQFLGVIRSAISNPPTICYFASHLASISLTIVKIINSGQC